MKNRAYFRGILLSALGLLLFSSQTAAQQVDTAELEKGMPGQVIFINYEGPHAIIETRPQIRNIGYSQGIPIRNGSLRSGGSSRYFVIHSMSPAEGDKLDADIFGLGVDVGVDHIRNLRLIIQGYLEAAYAYSAKDAALLSEYITIYNAVFRGNWNYFSSRYKTPVVGYLTSDKAGLSIRYDEWPGRTLMVIPLALGKPGSLSAIDTTALTSPEVKEQLRSEDQRGVAQRQDMVDLKERESDEAAERAQRQQEQVRQGEQQIAQDKAALAQEKQDIAQGRQEAAQERQQIEQAKQEQNAAPPPKTPEEAQAQQQQQEQLQQREEAVQQQEQQLDQREQGAQQQEAAIAQKEEDLNAQREEAKQSQEFSEQKAGEAQQERQEIAEDQRGIIAQQDQQAQQGGSPAGVLAMRITKSDGPLGSLIRLNTDSGTELKASPLQTVNGRTITQVQGKIITIAGENSGPGAIRLVEINPSTLEMDKQGEDDISPDSLIWAQGDRLYALTISNGECHLAAFGTDLTRLAQSAEAVHPFAAPVFQDDMILIQKSDGSPLILNQKDLSVKVETGR